MFEIDTLSPTLSAPEAYCLGGIISSSCYQSQNNGTYTWSLAVIHNPNKYPEKKITKHQRALRKILAPLRPKLLKKGMPESNLYLPPRMDGFVFLFNSRNFQSIPDIINQYSNAILTASDDIRNAFLTGVFDGRSSWDKHSSKIVLDCKDSSSANFIQSVLDTTSLHYDYNLARARKTGGPARNPQLRILAPDIPLFMSSIGFISTIRLETVSAESKCKFLTQNSAILPGLALIQGLRISTQKRVFKTIPNNARIYEQSEDIQLRDRLLNRKIKISATKPTYSRKPKAKQAPNEQNGIKIYPRSHKTASAALQIADFKCEYKKSHPTFIRKRDDLPYMEPHHLIPLCYSDEFDVSLDTEENIVSLCSNCHNQLHYGKDKEAILRQLHTMRQQLLADAGIFITFDELLSMYK